MESKDQNNNEPFQNDKDDEPARMTEEELRGVAHVVKWLSDN